MATTTTQEYFSNLNRTDLEIIKNSLPSEFTSKEELSESIVI